MNYIYKSVKTRPTHQRKIGGDEQAAYRRTNTNGCWNVKEVLIFSYNKQCKFKIICNPIATSDADKVGWPALWHKFGAASTLTHNGRSIRIFSLWLKMCLCFAQHY